MILSDIVGFLNNIERNGRNRIFVVAAGYGDVTQIPMMAGESQ